MVSVPAGSVRVLKTLGLRALGKMSFSPDARYIAYDFPPKDDLKERDILLLPVDGSRETPLVQHPADDIVLGWAPDGKSLLFASDRTGTWDVWRVQIVGGNSPGSSELVKKDIGRITSLGFTQKGSFYYSLSIAMQEIYIATVDLAQGRILTPPAAVSRRFLASISTVLEMTNAPRRVAPGDVVWSSWARSKR